MFQNPYRELKNAANQQLNGLPSGFIHLTRIVLQGKSTTAFIMQHIGYSGDWTLLMHPVTQLCQKISTLQLTGKVMYVKEEKKKTLFCLGNVSLCLYIVT